MAEVAELSIKVNGSGGVLASSKALDQLDKKSVLAERSVNSLSEAAGRSSASFTSLTSVISKFGAVLGLSFSISTLSSFEQSMASVAAVTKASTDELEAMRDIAKDLGSTTEFTAGQAADGLKFLGMAGFSTSQAIASIPAVLDLATGASMGLADAADIASNVMSGFGIAASEAAGVADVLAAASTRSNTSVQQLGHAMSTVAPVSAALKISLADTAAAIGALSDAGIQGDRAGTSLRGVLASLAGPTNSARKALAKMGLTVGDVNPETNSLSDIFAKLRERGIDTADAISIFGREAASGALVLVKSSDRLREFGELLTGVEGEAAQLAGTMRDNLQGDLLGVSSAFEGVIIAIGEAGLTKVLRTAIQWVTSLARKFTEVVNVAGRIAQSIAGYMKPALDSIAPVLSVISDNADIALIALAGLYAPAVIAGIGTVLVGALSAAKAGVIALTLAIRANPIGLLVSGIAVAMTVIWRFSDEIKKSVGVDVVNVFKTTANTITNFFLAAFQEAKFVWENLNHIAAAAVVGLVNVSVRTINSLLKESKSVINEAIALANKIPLVNIKFFEFEEIKEADNPFARFMGSASRHQTIKLAEIMGRDTVGAFMDGVKKEAKNLGDDAIPDAIMPALDINFDSNFMELGGGGGAHESYIKDIRERIALIGKETEAEQLLARIRVGAITFPSGAEQGRAIALAKEFDAIVKAQEAMEALKSYNSSMRERIELIGKETEAEQLLAKIRVGSIEFADQAAEKQALSMAKEYDDTIKLHNARSKLDSILRSSESTIESLSRKFREQVDVLRDAKVSGEEYAKAIEKISLSSISEAPRYRGLDAVIGGPSSEIMKIMEQTKELENWQSQQLSLQQQFLDQKLINEQTYADRVAEITQTSNQRLGSLQVAYQQATLASFATVMDGAASSLEAMGHKGSAVYKALFVAGKAASIAQAVVNTEEASTKALAIDPSGILSSAVRAAGYLSVATIAAQSIAGMAHSGIDSVPKDGTWLLQKGERVTTADTSAKLDSVLNDIRSGMATKGSGRGETKVNIVINSNSTSSVSGNDDRGMFAQMAADIQKMVDSRIKEREQSSYRQGGIGWQASQGAFS